MGPVFHMEPSETHLSYAVKSFAQCERILTTVLVLYPEQIMYA